MLRDDVFWDVNNPCSTSYAYALRVGFVLVDTVSAFNILIARAMSLTLTELSPLTGNQEPFFVSSSQVCKELRLDIDWFEAINAHIKSRVEEYIEVRA